MPGLPGPPLTGADPRLTGSNPAADQPGPWFPVVTAHVNRVNVLSQVFREQQGVGMMLLVA